MVGLLGLALGLLRTVLVVLPRVSCLLATNVVNVGDLEGHLVGLFDLDGRGGSRQQFLEALEGGRVGEVAVLGEHDLDDQVQVAPGVAPLQRHALAGDLEDLAGAEDLARGLGVVELEAAAVEVLDHDAVEAGQGLGEGDLQLGRQVVAGPLEDVVGLLDQVEDDVARLVGAGDLVRLPLQPDLVALPGAPRDVELELLPLLGDLFTLALLALVLGVPDLAGAFAGPALDHALGQHAGADLAQDLLDALPLAGGTLLGLGLVDAAAAAALGADDVLGGREFHRFALVQIFQRHLVFLVLVGAASHLPAPSAAHARHPAHSRDAATHAEHVQDVFHVDFGTHAAGAPAAVEGGHAVGVVEVSLFVVVEDLIGLAGSLESSFGLFSLLGRDFVRVVLEGLLPVRLADI